MIGRIDPEIQRQLIDLRKGETVTAGEFSLNVSSTTTVVTRLSVSANSVVHTQATSANANNNDILRIVPAKGQFTITHTSSTLVRTYLYDFVTGNVT